MKKSAFQCPEIKGLMELCVCWSVKGLMELCVYRWSCVCIGL